MEIREFIRHVTRNGWERLYHSPKDVRNPNDLVVVTPDFIHCTDELRTLHNQFVSKFDELSPRSIDWWRNVVEHHIGEDGDVRAGAMAAYQRWPAGPASTENMVELFREHWLACEERSNDLRVGGRMFPEDFLLSEMSEDVAYQRYLVVTAMPYWPIGLDENGNWC